MKMYWFIISFAGSKPIPMAFPLKKQLKEFIDILTRDKVQFEIYAVVHGTIFDMECL